MRKGKNMTHHSNSYVTTVLTVDDPMVATLKLAAKTLNAQVKAEEISSGIIRSRLMRYRVLVRPRLGHNSPHAHLYAKGAALHRSSSQTIRPEHGQRFDLYLAPTYRYMY